MSKSPLRSPRRPSPFQNKAVRIHTRTHTPTTGFMKLPKLTDGKVERLIHGAELHNQARPAYTILSTSPGAEEARKTLADALRRFEQNALTGA